ncbi:MAG: SpaH/EbpB family LPXTG-anchored major pilin [Lachnospiraceae bacterium]|nr:SpaH/EbpB family LPXTG-anchored major pilin [Lachnospiraceae bacterium]
MKRMKQLKKVMALVLAMVMVLAMGSLTALAEGANSITVNNAREGETYSAYKMLDLSVNADKTAFTYTVNSAWNDFFKAPGEDGTGEGAGYSYVNIDSQGYVSWKEDKKSDSDREAFAKAAASYVKTENISVAATAKGVKGADDRVTASLTGLEDGYYLVTSSLGTLAMTETTPRSTDVIINEKNKDNTLDKKVKEDSNDDYVKENDAQIGDTIEYKVEITLVKGAKNVVYHDSVTTGLTYTTGSVAIDNLKKGNQYTVNENPDDGHTFDITFTQTYLDSLTNDITLTLTYTAILNENAATNQTQTNTAKLTWGNAGSVESTTTTKTYKFAVKKYADSIESLAGAVFQLQKNGAVVKLVKINDTTYRVATADEIAATENNKTVETFTTVNSGVITIVGVDNDTDYTLVETQAPAGYNKLENPVSVTNIVKEADGENDKGIDGINSINTIPVENKTGTTLPSTGGTGTTIFYILGSILVIGAGILLITKKRMSARNN